MCDRKKVCGGERGEGVGRWFRGDYFKVPITTQDKETSCILVSDSVILNNVCRNQLSLRLHLEW